MRFACVGALKRNEDQTSTHDGSAGNRDVP
jgi:hypothetical protein